VKGDIKTALNFRSRYFS